MNYFELYQLPVSFHPDQNVVKQQFYALSKKYHPDFYINESQEKQDEVLELSTLNNKAFQVLKNPQKVLQYVLELKGVISEGENYTLPQSFLMEMMDVNETIVDLQFDPDAAKLADVRGEIAQIEQSLNTELNNQTAQFENQELFQQQATLANIKDIYYRNKYIQRLKESLAKL
ncbi:MAG: iron-sulfur cluster co-chaperone HscB C-terminal domain-containing protein [Pedobacter sp.]|uniref:iron-sulfur cluster co-chaperone HscB C-terminal domain-containing protein n=1 Tax=Pedobacter sp. TaxID=1411316 RepID=UPI00280766BC|nr:iron-sulfur cluster co-chaperone HscB C-terminal domain-containing protein [Pedobacter sp.]MDQ8003554.1 iron-sulfur cluster co-chaperone HscB C-terminal domain-containing protein [Pedobacter sp.]